MQTNIVNNFFNKIRDNKKEAVYDKIMRLSDSFNDAYYYKEAKSWRQEIYQSQAVWLNRSMVANCVLSLLLILSFIIIQKQIGAHIVEPILIEKDKETGSYSVVDRVTPESVSSDWSLTRFNLMHYVESREQYHYDNIDAPYQDAYYKSSNSVADELARDLSFENEQSPINIYKDSKYVTVKVNNIQKLNSSDTALVEFTKTLHEKGSSRTKDFHYRAIVRWDYSDEKMELKQYYRNPFNFRVTYYKASIVTSAKG